MSHPEITLDHEWRVEQLKFLFNLGLCEISNVGVELVCKYLLHIINYYHLKFEVLIVVFFYFS